MEESHTGLLPNSFFAQNGPRYKPHSCCGWKVNISIPLVFPAHPFCLPSQTRVAAFPPWYLLRLMAAAVSAVEILGTWQALAIFAITPLRKAASFDSMSDLKEESADQYLTPPLHGQTLSGGSGCPTASRESSLVTEKPTVFLSKPDLNICVTSFPVSPHCLPF